MASSYSSGSAPQWNPNDYQTQWPPSYDQIQTQWPPSYDQIQTNGEFTFIDFLPIARAQKGIFNVPKFDNFRVLVDRANDWLRVNPGYRVVTCESVEFIREGLTQMETQKMTYYESGSMSTSYVRALRLWIEKPRTGGERVQQIGYMNVLPRLRKRSGIFSYPSYENLTETVSRYNAMNQTHPIPGRIITVESQEMKTTHPDSIDPDESSWSEPEDMQKHFVFIIRVFYEILDGVTEQLGIADFIPDVISKGGIFKFPQYEPFSNVMMKASTWIAAQSGIRVCNAQSLEIKVERGNVVNGQRMSYIEHGSISTYYVRILRVAFTIQSQLNVSTIRELTCKTFFPVPLTTGIFAPKFESLMQTKHRVSEWVKATGVQVISAETSALRVYNTSRDIRHGIETSFSYNKPEKGELWIYVIKLYIYGSYQEPPPAMLPPVPVPEKSSCTIA